MPSGAWPRATIEGLREHLRPWPFLARLLPMRQAVPARPWHKARPELRVIACCYTAISGKFGKIKAGFDCDVVNLSILGSDQYQLIAQQIDARGFLSRAVVHPLQVSG